MKQEIFTFKDPCDGKMRVGRFVIKPAKRTIKGWEIPIEMQIGSHSKRK